MTLQLKPLGMTLAASGASLSVLWAGFAAASCTPVTAGQAVSVALLVGMPMIAVGAAMARVARGPKRRPEAGTLVALAAGVA